MTDFRGQELNVGDHVIYIRKFGASGCELAFGNITRIKGKFGKEVAEIDTSYISFHHSQNVYKLEK
jgi:hypothetical protein